VASGWKAARKSAPSWHPDPRSFRYGQLRETGAANMIKLTFCLHRLPSLSREAFQDYWLNKHAPLVAKHKDTLRIRRYVQMHTATTDLNDGIRAGRGGPEMYDGVAELWWDSLEDIVSDPTPERQAAGLALLEDECKFIDLARSPLWFGEEKVIFG
jgi:uncharacterized protein (TIGR02118 family)